MCIRDRTQCDYLIAAIQIDPSIDREEKNKPVQSIVERQLQVKAVRWVDDFIVYSTEKELEDIFSTLPIDVRIIGEEYKDKFFTGKEVCLKRNIDIYYNSRQHNFSTTDLRNQL